MRHFVDSIGRLKIQHSPRLYVRIDGFVRITSGTDEGGE